jgi:penicillin-binding protein 2
MKKSTYDAVHEGLWMVVNAAGTGGRGRVPGYNVAGKTGTSQVVSNQNKAAIARTGQDVRDHGWFVFFAPHDKPEIAGVIFAEHAEHGYLGAPIARYAMETFFAKKEGRPLPPLVKPAAPVITATNATPAPGGQ